MKTKIVVAFLLLSGAVAFSQAIALEVLQSPTLAGPINQFVRSSPLASGIVYRVGWSSVDFGPGAKGGQYQFAALDKKINADGWAQAGKSVNLVLLATSDLPAPTCPQTSGLAGSQNCAVPSYVWDLLGAGGAAMCNSQKTPNYLSAAWQRNFKNFVAQVYNHYGKSVGYIRIGPGHGGETSPPAGWDSTTSPCGKSFSRWGVNVATWELYLQGMITFQAAIRSTITKAIGISPMGKPPSQVPAFIVSLGPGFGFQGFTVADTKNCAGAVANWCELFHQTPARFHELQTLQPTCGSGTCRTGSLPGLLAFAKANGATVLELYAQDWLVALDPAYPGNKQFGAAYVAALKGMNP